MIRTVLFDVGGVLYNDPGKEMHKHIMQTLGLSEEDWYSLWNEVYESFSKGKITQEEIFELLRMKFRLKKHIPNDLFLRAHAQTFERIKPMHSVLEKLRNQGNQLGILSNSYKPHAQYNREHYVYDGFSPVILSCEVGMKKPEEAIFSYAVKKCGGVAGEILFLDDKEANVEAAKKIGMLAEVFSPTPNLTDLFALYGMQV